MAAKKKTKVLSIAAQKKAIQLKGHTMGFKSGISVAHKAVLDDIAAKKKLLKTLPKSQQSDVEACIQCGVAIAELISKFF